MRRNARVKKIFISYSRKDGHKVYPLVEFLRATGVNVFLDIDSIEFGEQWEEVLENSIREAGRILVFWSRSAAQSEFVEREYLLALRVGVRVIPVPIDGTPLPLALAKFQALTGLLPILDKLEKTPLNGQRFSISSWKIAFLIVFLVGLLIVDSNTIRVFIIALVVLIIVIMFGNVGSIDSISSQVDEMLFSDFDSGGDHHDHHDHGDHDDHGDH